MKGITKDRRKNKVDSINSLVDRRQNPFTIIPANSRLLKKIYYELRHTCYITENRVSFEDEVTLDKIETDQYDRHSKQFLLFYKPLHLFIGGLRIIIPNTKLPFLDLPTVAKSQKIKNIIPKEDRDLSAEVSRFFISKERSKICMTHIRQETPTDLKTILNHKFMTLMSPCFNILTDYNLKYFIFSMERSLIKILQQHKLNVIDLSETIRHHGEVKIAYLNLREAKNLLTEKNPTLLQFFTQTHKDSKKNAPF